MSAQLFLELKQLRAQVALLMEQHDRLQARVYDLEQREPRVVEFVKRGPGRPPKVAQ